MRIGGFVRYTKRPLTIKEQVDLLLGRGMTGDRDLMMRQLTVVNYYRLSGYCHTFRNRNSETFHPGTTFELVWKTYAFDRRLRLLVMDALERIEVAVGSLVAYVHSHEYGAFGYASEPASFPGLNAKEHAVFVERVSEQTRRSRDTFVRHFCRMYGDEHNHLPIWMAVEVMSFSTILKLFTGSHKKVKESVASTFGVTDVVFESWLLALSTVRNICAHHGRLWNREIGTKPKIPRLPRYPDWHVPIEISNRRTFAILTICRYCLKRVAPQSSWFDRFEALLREFPTIPRENMGFPDNWRQSPIWQREDADTRSD